VPQMNRRVVLITPYGEENRGIRYISAMLRKNGFEPHMIFFKRWVNNALEPPTEREEELLADLVRQIRPVLVGVGFGAPHLKVVRSFTRRIRAVSDATLLWGGVFPTVCPEDCIDDVDAVCIGEGEYATLEVARALAEGRSLRDIEGLWVKEGTEVHRNPVRQLIQDLDALPFPDCLQPDTWFIEDGRKQRTDPVAGTVEYRIYPTRGCPYTCTYCHSHVMRRLSREGGGRYYRIRSVENVIAELEAARSILPKIRRVKFDGDVFAFPQEWLEEFSRSYRERIGVPFEILTYPGELDAGDYALLKRAGLRKVQTGIQSGSEKELRDAYRRQSTSGDILELHRMVRREGIEVVYDLIFDNPLASEGDKRSIVELLLKLEHPFSIYMYSLTLFPKTRLAQDLIEQGLATPDDIEGRATKSYRQFRLSFDWPRPPEDRFWIALTVLAAKPFVPKALIRHLMESRSLRKTPDLLVAAARMADLAKVGTLALRMLLQGELTVFKLRQYGSFKRVISQ